MARFYITTSIMYTNAPPHIGFALELIQADAIARYRRMKGDEVRFLTGTDEHGTKIMRASEQAGVEAQEFVDTVAGQVRELATRLNVSNTDFIRTSDRARHWPGVQKIWRAMAEKGDIYKKTYEGYYCVGHEAFIKQSEMIDGLCPVHKTKPELTREENWFFKVSRYSGPIRKLIESGGLRIVPDTRKAEILNLLNDVEDVSFSRPSEQLSWGIPVPDDPSQTIYVWADALTNYISALGYGSDEKAMEYWPAQTHLIGKDIVRFHAIYWPAMLLAAGLDIPRSITVHGFITVNGEKMSKTVGNVINPTELLDQYETDVVRYFMLRELRSTDDSDFSVKNLENRHNADLANGLGNLVQRVATLVHTKISKKIVYRSNLEVTEASLVQILDDAGYDEAFDQFRLHDATAIVWEKIGLANAYLNDRQPWKQEGDAQYKTLITTVAMISHIAWLLSPLMPSTAGKVSAVFGVPLDRRLSDGQPIAVTLPEPLFPRTQAE